MSNAIDLYAWPTPNAYKISIFLEEAGIPYNAHPVNITKGDQHSDAFRAMNPNGKMPVMVDPNGPDGAPITLFESGAILWYLAEKTGQFLPASAHQKHQTHQWLMWQMAGFGPMLGQAHHFRMYAPEKIQYGIERYTNEAKRLYAVLNERLGQSAFVAGDDYTIADMAIFPWALLWEKQGVERDAIPHVLSWIEKIGARDAVKRGLNLLSDHKRKPDQKFSDEERKTLFGNK